MPAALPNEQLQLAVTSVVKVIGQIPCFHVYEEYVAGRFGHTEAEIALQATMHNAAIDSTLIRSHLINV